MSIRSRHKLVSSAEPRIARLFIALGIVVASACATQTPPGDTPGGTPTGGGAATDDLSSQNLAAGQQGDVSSQRQRRPVAVGPVHCRQGVNAIGRAGCGSKLDFIQGMSHE